jgi:hypothetical protein
MITIRWMAQRYNFKRKSRDSLRCKLNEQFMFTFFESRSRFWLLHSPSLRVCWYCKLILNCFPSRHEAHTHKLLLLLWTEPFHLIKMNFRVRLPPFDSFYARFTIISIYVDGLLYSFVFIWTHNLFYFERHFLTLASALHAQLSKILNFL